MHKDSHVRLEDLSSDAFYVFGENQKCDQDCHHYVIFIEAPALSPTTVSHAFPLKSTTVSPAQSTKSDLSSDSNNWTCIFEIG